MQRFRLDPFLWIHLAGLATLPIWLGLCLLGFAVGYPVFPVTIEFLLVAALGILPVLWMQWFRPFYIYSILAIAIKPEQLTTEQQRILTSFKTQRHQGFAIITPVLLLPILWQLYRIAPLATDVAGILPNWRVLGLAIAAIAFCGCNLFTQVPISVLLVFFTSRAQLNQRNPLSPAQISQGFTIVGWKVDRILPITPNPEKTS